MHVLFPFKGIVFPHEGIVAIWKPIHMTSYDVIRVVRRATGVQNVGHAGTLDPLASGVLVVGIGRPATRHLGQVVLQEKEYRAVVRLGATSATDDEEGEKTYQDITRIPGIDEVEKIVRNHIGIIVQTPPMYSALKIKGKPAYAYARAGEAIIMKPRRIEIKDIEILSYAWPVLTMRVVTGPGAYIRALARDIGAALKVGGYLTVLERMRVGQYAAEGCIRLSI